MGERGAGFRVPGAADRRGRRALPGVRQVVLACVLAGAGVVPAAAQQPAFSVSVLGGVSFPVAEAADAMGLGWNLGVAGDVRLSSALRLRADYLYNRYAAEQKTIDVGLGPMLPAFRRADVSGKSQMHFVSVDLVWVRENLAGRRFFVMGGPTFFRRRVQLTTTGDDRGIASACEPQWLQCSPETIGFDRWLGIKKSDDFGFNVGAGLTFPTGLTADVVIEARYYWVSGPSYTSASGSKESGSAMFVPVSVGLRF